MHVCVYVLLYIIMFACIYKCKEVYLLARVLSTKVTVATPGLPTTWPLVIEVIEMLNISSSSIILSELIIMSNETLVNPIGKVTA